ncbi:MAG: glycoside hydrolase family 3 C-terminal domain-containing protein [bacterium]
MTQARTDSRYRDPKLPPGQRAEILVAQMTLREKIAQMLHRAPPIPRLDVPAYNWWNECLHGVGRAGRATVFPQAIGLAATFNVPLVRRIAAAVSDEARAKHHQALRQGNRSMYLGLTYWTPNINIFRDPRWGRGQETYGECPFLTARMGVAFVKGLQGKHPRYLKLVATPKHFAVHSGPEPLRHGFNAVVSARDLRETYLPAFQACVQEGGAWSVMGAYNRTNGEPCCGSATLLQKILREEWGFPGYVVSDCWAIKDFHEAHKATATPEESVALAVKNGCDLNCGDIYPRLLEAVKQGLVREDEISRSVERLFTARFKLGMFDPEKSVPWSKLPPKIVNGPQHRKLARRAAQESIVLLKNADNLLPLKKDTHSILVVGPIACAMDVLLGNYNGLAPRLTTLLEGIAGAVSAGSKVQWCFGKGMADLDWHLSGADVVVACLGFTPEMEGEEIGDVGVQGEGGGDRLSIGLPGRQLEVLQNIQASGKPVVMVLTGGSPIELNWAKANIPAILMVWYPGEAGGQAVADVLFGDYNPAGRLPVTFIQSLEDIPPFTDYSMRGRTYRFMEKEPLYPFGYGLSYTTFKYSNLRVSGLKMSVAVKNTGSRDGDEVVQVYISYPPTNVPAPLRQLAGFQRIHVRRGQKKTVTFQLKREQFAAYDDNGKAFVPSGEFTVHIAGGQTGGLSAHILM